MLEDSKMDKKSLPNRSSQSQSRASAVDCKKNTDLTHKLWPRNNKKREASGSVPKNEPYRKNGPAQRGRAHVDKRPRARGSSNCFTGGTENTGLEEVGEPEIGSVFVPGSKKQNLNHLLNFKYPSRGGVEHRTNPPRRQTHQRVIRHHDHDLYLRTYCQFVVKEEGDYEVNLLDPDVPIKWEQIEEIVVRSTGRSECPICLGSPVAGRVGVCGHVYCWPCILHYADTHEKQPPPCPVCTTAIRVKEMKPTKIVQWSSPAEEVTMRLVRRLRGSTIVEIAPPRGQLSKNNNTSVLPLENICDAPYAKLFKATKQQVHEILDRERKELNDQILAEIDTSEIVYLEKALELLKLKETVDTEFDEAKNIEVVAEVTPPIVYEEQEVIENKLDWFDVDDQGAASVNNIQDQNYESNLNPEAAEFNQSVASDEQPLEFPLMEPLVSSENQEISDNIEDVARYFYFYQAEDGQQVFLHNLNVALLKYSYGNLAAAPPIIRARVLHRATTCLDDDTRKRAPFTSHLPLHCSYDIVDLDLKPPIVTTAALERYADDLKRRAKERARIVREQRRLERAYRLATEGPPKPDFFSDEVFPPTISFSQDNPPLSEPPLSVSPEQASPPVNAGASPSGLSFAKMASTCGTWRVRKAHRSPSPAPAEDDPTVPRALVLSDAIEAALHAAPTPAGKKQKNRKSKQKVLFSIGMHRAE